MCWNKDWNWIDYFVTVAHRTVKSSRDAYIKRLNGIYENNLNKVHLLPFTFYAYVGFNGFCYFWYVMKTKTSEQGFACACGFADYNNY